MLGAHLEQARLSLNICVVALCLLASASAAESQDTLSAARALWSKSGPESYSYVLDFSSTAITVCRVRSSEFVQISHPLRLTVRAGRIERVNTVQGQDVPSTCFGGDYKNLYTIEKLFELIERDGQKRCGNLPNIEAKYDVTYGFPYHIEQNCLLDGGPITVRAFRVLK
jgi:hypothetical protein